MRYLDCLGFTVYVIAIEKVYDEEFYIIDRLQHVMQDLGFNRIDRHLAS